jgi:hypothetical protein
MSQFFCFWEGAISFRRFDSAKRFGGAACGRYGPEVAVGAVFSISTPIIKKT